MLHHLGLAIAGSRSGRGIAVMFIDLTTSNRSMIAMDMTRVTFCLRPSRNA